MPLREHLEGLLSRTRRPERREQLEEELRVPPPPKALLYLWQTFGRLSNRRGSTGFGPAAIGWGDIADFVRLTRFEMLPWEIEVIEALDTLYLAAAAKSDDRPVKQKQGR